MVLGKPLRVPLSEVLLLAPVILELALTGSLYENENFQPESNGTKFCW